jgi:hypothetical protein
LRDEGDEGEDLDYFGEPTINSAQQIRRDIRVIALAFSSSLAHSSSSSLFIKFSYLSERVIPQVLLQLLKH